VISNRVGSDSRSVYPPVLRYLSLSLSLSLSRSVCACVCFDVWGYLSGTINDYSPRHTMSARYMVSGDGNNSCARACVYACVCALAIGIGFDRRRVAASSFSFRPRSRSRGGGIMKIKWRIKKRGRRRSMRTFVSRDAALAARGPRKGRERVTECPA